MFRRLQKISRRKAFTFGFIVMLLFYAIMTGWSVSVTRAIVLILLKLLADRLSRSYDLTTALGLSAVGAILIHPCCVFSASFQMSYLAVASIAFIGPRLTEALKNEAGTIIAVQLAMIPYTSYTFNYVPLLGIIANIPAVFLLTLIVPIGLLDMVLFASLGTCFGGNVLSGLCGILVKINGLMAFDGLFTLDTVSIPLFALAWLYMLLFLCSSETFRLLVIRKEWKRIAALFLLTAAVTVLLVPASLSPLRNADIVMVDVGQGDCMHFRYDTNGSVPGGKRDVVIDGGGKDGYNIGKKVLKPYFLKSGAGRVELAYATHLHTDHFKGLEELAAEGMIYKLVTRGRTGDVIKFAGSSGNRIEIIYPDIQDPNAEDENLNSLIFKVHIEGVTVLITGDLGEEGELALVEKYKGTDVLDCDILKVSHHGSRYSSCNEFLRAVSPKIALIGVGKKNTYGHPAGEVIERLAEAGTKVYRTDRDGAIGIKIENGGTMNVETYK